ncbi:MAG: hypothetical protein ACRBN8_29195 [Nannocystales bacterium]
MSDARPRLDAGARGQKNGPEVGGQRGMLIDNCKDWMLRDGKRQAPVLLGLLFDSSIPVYDRAAWGLSILVDAGLRALETAYESHDWVGRRRVLWATLRHSLVLRSLPWLIPALAGLLGSAELAVAEVAADAIRSLLQDNTGADELRSLQEHLPRIRALAAELLASDDESLSRSGARLESWLHTIDARRGEI